MLERDDSTIAAAQETGQNAGGGDKDIFLIAEGDARFMVKTGAPYKDGDFVGVRIAGRVSFAG